jgi:hypothetical protein
MDSREILVDGIEQLSNWLDDALAPLASDQVNWLPDGKTTSIGFNAWHVFRTMDNVTNFVLLGKQPIWIGDGYLERFGLPRVAQGTGMTLDDARSIVINDVTLLREYGRAVSQATVEYVRTVPEDVLAQVQLVKPLGEMPRWRIVRQVLMTHGFMHLGEINLARGMLGLQFPI